jgi:FAD:protein FMN transferase
MASATAPRSRSPSGSPVSPDESLPLVPAAMRRHDFAAMGTTVSVVTEAEATGAGDAVERLFAEWEQCLSRFRPDSDLSRLNARAGKPATVRPLLFDVLSAALRAARATAGLYDPTLLRTLERLGYDRSFELLAQGASETPTGTSHALGGWRGIELDPRTRTVTLPAGVGVELGGIAKGMAVDAAIERLRSLGARAAMVSAGGDLRVHGLPEGMASWPIAVDGGAGPLTVALTHGALATSGIAKRRWRQGTAERHHLLDPRDGKPSRSGLWSVTVAAATCGQAEVGAKTAFILGPRAGIEFLERKGLAGLLVGRFGASWRCGSWPVAPGSREEAACSPASR